MIITKQKPFTEILQSLTNDPIYVIGCSECATFCQTGGEPEVKEMVKKILDNNGNVTGWVVLDPACHLHNDKFILRKYKEKINKAKKILILACGTGAQTVAEAVKDKEIITGTDTLFLGEILNPNLFEKRCIGCGSCIQDIFDSFCPIARCPKHMLNGPCGGVNKSKCEVYPFIDCIWIEIYNHMKKRGTLQQLKEIVNPLDWSKSIEIRRNLKNGIP
jgi:ferredoxin